MTQEQIIALEKEMDDKIDYLDKDGKNPLFKALQILSKYSDHIEGHAEHDEYTFWIDNYEDISEEDLKAIFRLRTIWWSEEYECFYHFT